MIINFYDKNYLFQKSIKLYDIPLNKELILQKSIEYFDDYDPCIIHTNYIHKRLIFELEEILSKGKLVKETYCKINNNKILNKYLKLEIAAEYYIVEKK